MSEEEVEGFSVLAKALANQGVQYMFGVSADARVLTHKIQ